MDDWKVAGGDSLAKDFNDAVLAAGVTRTKMVEPAWLTTVSPAFMPDFRTTKPPGLAVVGSPLAVMMESGSQGQTLIRVNFDHAVVGPERIRMERRLLVHRGRVYGVILPPSASISEPAPMLFCFQPSMTQRWESRHWARESIGTAKAMSSAACRLICEKPEDKELTCQRQRARHGAAVGIQRNVGGVDGQRAVFISRGGLAVQAGLNGAHLGRGNGNLAAVPSLGRPGHTHCGAA